MIDISKVDENYWLKVWSQPNHVLHMENGCLMATKDSQSAILSSYNKNGDLIQTNYFPIPDLEVDTLKRIKILEDKVDRLVSMFTEISVEKSKTTIDDALQTLYKLKNMFDAKMTLEQVEQNLEHIKCL